MKSNLTLPFILKLFFICLLSFKLMACMSTRQTSYHDQQSNSPISFERTVQFELSDSFYNHAPRCITIMPMKDENSADGALIEEAFTRHLFAKVNKVIGPKDRDYLTRKMAIDLTHPQDRKSFARNMNCKYFLSLRPLNDKGDYLFFWSREAMGAEAILTSVDEHDILWKGRHVADRNDGGLPLTPMSAVISLFEANSLSNDADISASLSDDLARRILATLPAIRDQVASW